jgi:Flp pilus assembly pilin Flp
MAGWRGSIGRALRDARADERGLTTVEWVAVAAAVTMAAIAVGAYVMGIWSDLVEDGIVPALPKLL